MATRPKPQYTPEEYLALERRAQYKSEYVDGEIFAMAGGSREHSLIASNIIAHVYQRLGDDPCEVHGSDLRVQIRRRRYYYPDVTIVCGKPEFEDDKGDTLVNPTVIFEVLSTTTQDYDKGEKADFYRSIASLTDLIFIHQDKYLVQHYTRRSNREWLLIEYPFLDDTLNLMAIGCELKLSEIYRRINLPTRPDDGAE